MSILISTVIILLAVILSIVASRWIFTKISVNYVYILMGMIVAVIPFLNQSIIRFNADFFMGIIVAPLLFFEGQNTRMNLVLRNIKTILSLTVMMVLLTTIFVGFSTSVILGVSLPLAFILAAISTPTDATATESVTNGLIMPDQQSTNLKLESLFNDASGIVLLNMAILWYVNGTIKYGATLGNFAYSAVGGVITGIVIAGILVSIRQAMLHSKVNFIGNTYNTGIPLKLIYLLTPYLIYYLAEAIEVSGIIAVVFAGLVHNAESQRSELSNPRLAYDTIHLTALINSALNGIVFVTLGIMFVRVIKQQIIGIHDSYIWLVIGIILYLGNLLVRYLYVRTIHHQNNKNAWLFSLGGIHGAVTFALAVTVAEAAVQTQDFRTIVLAENTLIILSMIIPTILFHFLLPAKHTDNERQQKIANMRQEMVNNAINIIHHSNIPAEIKAAVIFDLRSQNGNIKMKEFWQAWTAVIRHSELSDDRKKIILRTYRTAFEAERAYLKANYNNVKLTENDFNLLYQETMNAELVILGQYTN